MPTLPTTAPAYPALQLLAWDDEGLQAIVGSLAPRLFVHCGGGGEFSSSTVILTYASTDTVLNNLDEVLLPEDYYFPGYPDWSAENDNGLIGLIAFRWSDAADYRIFWFTTDGSALTTHSFPISVSNPTKLFAAGSGDEFMVQDGFGESNLQGYALDGTLNWSDSPPTGYVAGYPRAYRYICINQTSDTIELRNGGTGSVLSSLAEVDPTAGSPATWCCSGEDRVTYIRISESTVAFWRELLSYSDTLSWRSSEGTFGVAWEGTNYPIAACWNGQIVIAPLLDGDVG